MMMVHGSAVGYKNAIESLVSWGMGDSGMLRRSGRLGILNCIAMDNLAACVQRSLKVVAYAKFILAAMQYRPVMYIIMPMRASRWIVSSRYWRMRPPLSVQVLPCKCLQIAMLANLFGNIRLFVGYQHVSAGEGSYIDVIG